MSIKLRWFEINVSFSFFAVIALVCLWGSGNSVRVMLMLLCCLLHEMGHLCAMCIVNSRPVAVTFYGGGIKITPEKKRLNSDLADVFILLSGCAVNFILAMSSIALCGRMTFFSQTNILLGVFNMLPLRYFDGGKVLEILVGNTVVLMIIRFIFIALSAGVVVVTAIDGSVSPSLLAVVGYILLSEIISVR